jgi:hypothetical protein
MAALGIVAVFLSFAVLAAHFLRSGEIVLVGATLCLLVLLAIPKAWAARVLQLVLLAASIEWIRTMVEIVHARMAAGMPYTRTVLILSGVALYTLATAFAFHLPAMRRRYGLTKP